MDFQTAEEEEDEGGGGEGHDQAMNSSLESRDHWKSRERWKEAEEETRKAAADVPSGIRELLPSLKEMRMRRRRRAIYLATPHNPFWWLLLLAAILTGGAEGIKNEFRELIIFF